MTFRQLHYTSCEHGLSGHSGFQFCAMSPGVPQGVIREVEQLTAYEPPLSLRASEAGKMADYPVNLIHAYSEFNGSVIIAQVVFTGLDFSNRSGNYFAHSLVSDDAQADLGALLPVELWAAPFWQSRQAATSELPPLPAPLAPGSISVRAIDDSLTGRPEYVAQLGMLLTAVDDAMGNGQQVLLVEFDSAAVCRWIAAICYLLGPKLGRQLTFTTYSHDPRRCRTHVVGTIAVTGSARLDAGTVFQTFDLPGGFLPELAASPAAALLSGIGVARSAELWRLAVSLGELPDSLDESFPVLASAALLLGCALTEPELDAAVQWLAAGAHQVSDEHKVTAVRSLLRQRRDQLPGQRGAELIALAVAADVAGGQGEDELTTEVERALVDDFFTRLDRSGLPRDAHIRYRTAGARAAAAAGCVTRLPRASAERAIELLDWAMHARLKLPAALVRDIGHGTVMTAILQGATPSGLGQVAAAWPALRNGMLDRLQELPAAAQQAAFASLGWDMFPLDDLEPYPALAEQWSTYLVERRRLRPAAALPRVVELRRRRGLSPAVDEELLSRLWPSVGWTPGEAAEVLKQLPVEELSAEPVQYRLAAILHNAPPGPADAEWMTFVVRLGDLPPGAVNDHRLATAVRLKPAITLIRQAQQLPKPPNPIVNQLLDLYDEGDPEMCAFLDSNVPPLLVRYPSLTYALSNCAESLLGSFCWYAREVLEHGPDEIALAAKTFTVMCDLRRNHLEARARYLEADVLEPVLPGWDRRVTKRVADAVSEQMKGGRERFEAWLEQQPGGGWSGDDRSQRWPGSSRPGFFSRFRPSNWF